MTLCVKERYKKAYKERLWLRMAPWNPEDCQPVTQSIITVLNWSIVEGVAIKEPNFLLLLKIIKNCFGRKSKGSSGLAFVV
jgi:hypothetical protein